MIACRNTKKCEAAAKKIEAETKKKVDFMTCDLASFKSILAFTNEFKSKYKRLDSLILNAGLGSNGFAKTADGIEMSIGMCLAELSAKGKLSVCVYMFEYVLLY